MGCAIISRKVPIYSRDITSTKLKFTQHDFRFKFENKIKIERYKLCIIYEANHKEECSYEF